MNGNNDVYECACGATFASATAYALHAMNCKGRVNWNEWIVAIALAAVVAVSVFSPAYATGRRDGEQAPAQPTPSISTPPANQSYVVYLPIAATEPDEVTGQGRYWGGQYTKFGVRVWPEALTALAWL